jgi:hypothetical protein
VGPSFTIGERARGGSIAATMSQNQPPPGGPTGPRLRPVEEWDSFLHGDTAGGEQIGLDDEFDYDLEEDAFSTGDRMRAWGGHFLVRLGWLALAAALAFGSAGIVAATSHAPSQGHRRELTYGADRELSATLDGAVRDLALLSDDVQSLGEQTRKAISSLAQVNKVGLSAAWDAGSNDLNAIETRAARLDASLGCATWDAARRAELLKTNSPDLIARYDQVCVALGSVAPLHDDWQSLVAESKTAMQVATDINDHDQIAAEALRLATSGQYAAALARIDDARVPVNDAGSIATDLAKLGDVSTLQDWLQRTTNMDNALAVLWGAMVESKGEVTAKVTAALKNVNDATALLPDDNSVMQIVLHELAGGLTSDGIAIETAKGQLGTALSNLVQTQTE